MRSATVRVRDQFVMARYGTLSRKLYRSKLAPDVRETIEVPGDRWVPFPQFVEATSLACELFGHGDLALAREIGAFGAEANMGVWRSFAYRILSPQQIMALASGLWRHHYDGGFLHAERFGAHGVRLQIRDFPTPHPAHCLSIQGWCKRTLEMGGPRSVELCETACRVRGDDVCELVAEWG